ncbi:hypothetical protein Hamer_G002328 [Homarus americanus]|uniref:Uncharacterized protein n=1 Tax=Homarus americanus TaxID=6706 RepID=A0A8J5MYK4_HOMAM|nr:hypothetical protein Hamer_G002328 [Homarus americanus]
MASISLVALLLVVITLATETHNSKLQWDDDSNNNQGRLSAPYNQHPMLRADRKLVFINNKAYDMSADQQTRAWDLYLKKGSIPDHQFFNRISHMDSLSTAMTAPAVDIPDDNAVALDQNSTQEAELHKRVKAQDSEVGDPIVGEGTFRFVANPDKIHLIEVVDKEELQELYSTTVAPVVATEPNVDVSTVHYEATQVSLLTFIWTELINLGELLGREVVGTVSDKLWYWWKSLVKFVQARGRRSINHQSAEL